MTVSDSAIIANVKEILIYQVNNVHILAQKWVYFLTSTKKNQNYKIMREVTFVFLGEYGKDWFS